MATHNPIDRLKQHQERDRLDRERMVSSELEVVFNEFISELPDIATNLEKRDYTDCSIVVWNDSEYVGYLHKTMNFDAGTYGLNMWTLLDQEARPTSLFSRRDQFARHEVTSNGTRIVDGEQVGRTELRKLLEDRVVSLGDIRNATILAKILRHMADRPDEFQRSPAGGSVHQTFNNTYEIYALYDGEIHRKVISHRGDIQ